MRHSLLLPMFGSEVWCVSQSVYLSLAAERIDVLCGVDIFDAQGLLIWTAVLTLLWGRKGDILPAVKG